MIMNKHILKIIKEGIGKNFFHFIVVITVVILGKGIILAVPVISGHAVDLLIINKVSIVEEMVKPLLWLTGILIFSTILGPMSGFFISSFIKKIMMDKTKYWISLLFYKDIDYFEHKQVGDFVHRVASGIFAHEIVLTHTINKLLPVFIEFLLTVILFFYFGSWQLFFFIVLILVIYYLITVFLINKRQKHIDIVVGEETSFVGELTECLMNRKILAIEKAALLKIEVLLEHIKKYNDVTVKLSISESSIGQLHLLSANSVILAIVGISPGMVTSNNISVGHIVILLSLASLMVNAFNSIISTREDSAHRFTQIDRFLSILNKSSFFREGKVINDVSLLKISAFKLNNKSTKFKNEKERVFHKGEKVAIVGPSGQGKTIFLEIIAGLSKEARSVISVDSNRVEDLSSDCHFDIIRYCPQENYILPGVLSESIFFKKGLDPMILNTFKYLGLNDRFLANNMMLSPKGANISGGEARRLTLSRLLIKPGMINIFDEPTTSLDYETSNLVWDKLFSLSSNSILICTTHDHARLKDFDRIIYINDSTVIKETKGWEG